MFNVSSCVICFGFYVVVVYLVQELILNVQGSVGSVE